jgi:hypothetical protein
MEGAPEWQTGFFDFMANTTGAYLGFFWGGGASIAHPGPRGSSRFFWRLKSRWHVFFFHKQNEFSFN